MELENSEIDAKNEGINITHEDSALVQENSEIEEKNHRKSSSYEEQRTNHLYASNTHKKGGGQNLFISKDNKVMHLYKNTFNF